MEPRPDVSSSRIPSRYVYSNLPQPHRRSGMRTIRRWLPLLLVGLPLDAAAAFWGGIVVTDHLEEDNTFCTACHLHEKKFTEFHPVEGRRVTLAGAHNLAGDKNVKCIDCHIGATFNDKLIIKVL